MDQDLLRHDVQYANDFRWYFGSTDFSSNESANTFPVKAKKRTPEKGSVVAGGLLRGTCWFGLYRFLFSVKLIFWFVHAFCDSRDAFWFCKHKDFGSIVHTPSAPSQKYTPFWMSWRTSRIVVRWTITPRRRAIAESVINHRLYTYPWTGGITLHTHNDTTS